MASPDNPDIKRPTDEMVDVLIIGAGASGAVMAWSLAETKMKILCLEQGDWVKPTEFPTNGRDWEARRYGDFDISPNRRGRDTDYPVNDDNSPMKVANFNGVGGGTVIYTAHWPRMHPSDFRVKSLDGVADDWPVDYWTLERFYDENDRMMGVAGLAGDPGVPPRNPPMPPLPLGKTGTRYAQAMNRLGWHWWPSDSTVASTDYEGRGRCINLGHCTPGCAQGAKARPAADVTKLLADLPKRAERAVIQLERTLAAGDIAKARQEIRDHVGMVTIEADEHEVRLYGEHGVEATLVRVAGGSTHASIVGSGGPLRQLSKRGSCVSPPGRAPRFLVLGARLRISAA